MSVYEFILFLLVYDLEPQKLTGVIKYIGKVDKEFVDNRIYVGVKLDEPGTVSMLYNHAQVCPTILMGFIIPSNVPPCKVMVMSIVAICPLWLSCLHDACVCVLIYKLSLIVHHW